MSSAWVPASVRALRGYTSATFFHDLTAGVVVALVALPLAMAFAIASGLTPQAGIYCAIVTGFLISALGGSRTQIGGPTGAFVVVVAGIVAEHGVEGLYLCTMMAGVLLVILGVTGMGNAVKYLPRPVVVGFTNGIAVLIASTQIKDFFGLNLPVVPAEFAARMVALARNASTIAAPATIVAVCALAGMIVLRRLYPRIPGTVLALGSVRPRSRSWGWTSKPSAPASAAFLPDFPTHPFRPSRDRSSPYSSARPLPWRCSVQSNR